MSKKQVDVIEPLAKTAAISLPTITPLAKDWEIQAVLLINKPSQLVDTASYNLVAYDNNEEIIGKAK